MSKQKLHIYIVHQCAYFIERGGIRTPLEGHKILGIYLSKNLAEQHRDKLLNGSWLLSDAPPYIAVTKHTVRGSYIKHGDLVLL